MKEIPRWIIKVVEMEKLVCRACSREFGEEDLMSIGIQESSKPPHEDTLCIGMFCPKCKELIIFELKEMGLVDFAFEILDQETNNKIQKRKASPSRILKKIGVDEGVKRKKARSSKITLKEQKDSVKFLQKIKTHEEFLLAMGMLPDEIKKYNYKKPKPER